MRPASRARGSQGNMASSRKLVQGRTAEIPGGPPWRSTQGRANDHREAARRRLERVAEHAEQVRTPADCLGSPANDPARVSPAHSHVTERQAAGDLGRRHDHAAGYPGALANLAVRVRSPAVGGAPADTTGEDVAGAQLRECEPSGDR